MDEFREFDWDDRLIRAAREGCLPRTRVYCPNQVAVVLGRGSKPDVELHLDRIVVDSVPVMRRRGGGCSVVLDPGNLIASVAIPIPGVGGISPAYDRITEWLIAALETLNVYGVRREGTSDFALGGKKVGGSCIYRTLGLLYYTTTLLFEPELSLVERYLKHPPREPGYRAGRSHGEFMGSLKGNIDAANASEFAIDLNRALNDSMRSVLELGVTGNRTSKTQPENQRKVQ